ncbi:MAG: PQQ-binding-like beta-propeller repeat protein [Verrucomicrobia subdivision 3 bacterium]|nr:PQQ-binding-like beta-propeller repeat protein [Limisphaerales bacterium]
MDCACLWAICAFDITRLIAHTHALHNTMLNFTLSTLGVRLAVLFLAGAMFARGADQPQWGHAWTRNMVSAETNLPARFDPKTGLNIKWTAELGTETHSTPVVAGGRVYIGTNNGQARDPKHQGDRGVLMCFDEQTGQLLWQLVVPKREEDPYHDWPKTGLSSPVTVDGGRVYVVSNRGEVMCLDPAGLSNGNDGPYRDEGRHMTRPGEAPLEPGPLDADVLWLFDLTSGAGIWSHDAAHSSILVHGDHLYLNSGTGVDNTHKRIRTPDAPNLVVLDKHTGRYLAREREGIAPNTFHCTWSAPSMAQVNGQPLIFLAAGNGILYAFEPLPQRLPSAEAAGPFTLKKVWQFDFDPAAPKENVHRYNQNRREGPSNFYGMPVFHDGRVYLAGGGDLFWGKNQAWLKCIDAAKRGDVTSSAELWSYRLEKHVLSTPAIRNGLLFVADCGRKMHCLDLRTGQPHWTHEIKGEVWASPLFADGKVYLGTREGEFYVFAAAKEKELLHSMNLGDKISATVTAANGALYVATMSRLYSVVN